MSKRVRIKDIAKKAGVSEGTVDRVLHNRGSVSKKAREQVLIAMKELKYEPNQLARILVNNKTWRVATLLPSMNDDPFWEQPNNGIDRAIGVVKDYGVEVSKYFFDGNIVESFVKQCNIILAEAYDAVLIAPSFLQEAHHFFDSCEKNGIKYAQLNTYVERESEQFLFYIGQDSYHSGLLGAKLLNFALSEGETALILHLESNVHNASHLLRKEQGFEDYFSQLQNNKILTAKSSFSNVEDDIQFEKFIEYILQNHPKLKGIFVTTSKVFHLTRHLERMNIHNLKLVAFDLIKQNINYLKDDKIDFLVSQNPVKQGYLGIINLMNHFVFERTFPKVQHLPLDIVIKENYHYYLDENNYIT